MRCADGADNKFIICYLYGKHCNINSILLITNDKDFRYSLNANISDKLTQHCTNRSRFIVLSWYLFNSASRFRFFFLPCFAQVCNSFGSQLTRVMCVFCIMLNCTEKKNSNKFYRWRWRIHFRNWYWYVAMHLFIQFLIFVAPRLANKTIFFYLHYVNQKQQKNGFVGASTTYQMSNRDKIDSFWILFQQLTA